MFKKLLTITLMVLLVGLVGCSTYPNSYYLQDAYYVDHEFGVAQNDAIEQQIAHKDYKYAQEGPADMPGIHAEKIMDTYQDSFDKELDSNLKNFSRGYAIEDSRNTTNNTRDNN